MVPRLSALPSRDRFQAIEKALTPAHDILLAHRLDERGEAAFTFLERHVERYDDPPACGFSRYVKVEHFDLVPLEYSDIDELGGTLPRSVLDDQKSRGNDF